MLKQVGNIKFDMSKEHIIGEGSKGTFVYRGSLENGRKVAVKKVFTALCSAKEINLLTELKHPHIIPCWESAERDEFTYLALELCKGTLAQCVKNDLFKNELLLNELDCLEQIAEGVAYLHEQRVCHRDIKPENILVTFEGDSSNIRFVLADFSIARKVKDHSFSTSKSIAGTDGWIAQEHYQPGQTPSVKVDIFSCGCVFFYIITKGCHPFGNITHLKTCQSKINTKQPAMHLFNLNEAFSQLGDLVYAMVDADPKKRPTAKSVCNKLKVISSDCLSLFSIYTVLNVFITNRYPLLIRCSQKWCIPKSSKMEEVSHIKYKVIISCFLLENKKINSLILYNAFIHINVQMCFSNNY